MDEMRSKMVDHQWRQRGNEVYCKSCPFDHAFYVDTHTHLVGIENGEPILEKKP